MRTARWSWSDTDFGSEARFSPLLFCLLIYIFAILPVVEAGPLRNLVSQVVFSVLLVAGVLAISNSKRTLKRTAVIVALLIAADWWRYYHQSRLTTTVTLILVGFAISAGAYMVLQRVLTARRVSIQTIQGAVCGYLLLVLWWSLLYFLVDVFQENPFVGLGVDRADSSIDYVYFSFVTMTTLGFGDISPVTESARSLVTLQALVGQFYMAILVARLVAIQTRE